MINEPAFQHFTMKVVTQFDEPNNYTFDIDGSLVLVVPPGFDTLAEVGPVPIQVIEDNGGLLEFHVTTQFGGKGSMQLGSESKVLDGFRNAFGQIKWNRLLL